MKITHSNTLIKLTIIYKIIYKIAILLIKNNQYNLMKYLYKKK